MSHKHLTSVATMPPISADLPPNVQSALQDLQKALTEPPTWGDKWPFADPPGLVAARAKRKRGRGRPSAIAPHQVVILARFLRLGYTLPEAAARAKVSKQRASDLAAGRNAVCHHPAVTLTGVTYPMPRGPKRGGGAPKGPELSTPYPTGDGALATVKTRSENHPRPGKAIPDSPAPPAGAKTADPEAAS